MSSTECLLARLPMDQLAERIEAETGLHFSDTKRSDLGGAVRKMAAFKGFAEDQRCVEWLLEGRWDTEKAELCGRYLTIGETYFFREPRAFELVCDYARQRMATGGRDHAPLRIWSAGCCTGEEPYSIAMALRQAVPEMAPGKLFILATDINQASLGVARAGVYRQWSFRRTEPAVHARYFTRTEDKRYRIGAEIRDQVRFAHLNLALPIFPSAATQTHSLDIIFCRNVLMYFSKRQMKLVIERLRACLVDGGWLVVNPSEASSEMFEGFTAVYYPDAVYFQKKNLAQLAAPATALSRLESSSPVARAAGWVSDPVAMRSANQARAMRARSRTAPVAAEPGATVVAPAGVALADPELAALRPERRSYPNEPAGPTAIAAGRAYALARAGEVDAALLSLERAIALTPLAAELYRASAMIAMDGSRDAVAKQSLSRLLYLDPECALAHYLSAVVLAAQGARAAARRHFVACRELLTQLDDDALVPGSDGWPAASLIASVCAWLENDR